MFVDLFKRKLKEDYLANAFVNGIIDLVDGAFPEVASIINEEPLFDTTPNIPINEVDKFLFIVIGGNLKLISNHFAAYQDMRILDSIYRKLSVALGIELKELKQLIGSAQNLCSRKNHPSKNILRGMAIGVFYKYDLIEHQDAYFSAKEVPNPIILKKYVELMENFIWDWQAYTKKYKVVQ